MLLAKVEGKSNPRQIQEEWFSHWLQHCPKVLLMPSLLLLSQQILGKNQKSWNGRKRSEVSSCAQSHCGAVFRSCHTGCPCLQCSLSREIWDSGPKGIFFPPMAQPLNWRVCQQHSSVLNLARKRVWSFSFPLLGDDALSLNSNLFWITENISLEMTGFELCCCCFF